MSVTKLGYLFREGLVPEYYIITTRHAALWPRGVLLFWAENQKGYSSFLEKAGKYSEQEAKSICGNGPKQTEFMIPCNKIEEVAIRVVDLDKMKEFTGKSSWEFD